MQQAPKTFNLLSIGQRGVGKTVFLAGSYAQLQGNPLEFDLESDRDDRSRDHPQAFWFECQDQDVQANLEKILYHVQQTGLYPPATIKITDFNFRLHRETLRGDKLLCQFRWSDIPGEACNLRNPEFQDIVLTSHGCCVFINAQALINDPEYPRSLEDILNLVIAIASIVCHHHVSYPFAIVLTQCDRLEPGTITQLQLEQNLQLLIQRLDAIKANYQRFYSAIPIVSIHGASTLNAKGAADPLLWLLSQLNKHHRFQPERNLASSLAQSNATQLPAKLRRSIIVLAIASISLLGIAVSLLFALGLFSSPPNKFQYKNNEKTNHLQTVMFLLLGQLVYTSFPKVGFQALMSAAIPLEIRQAFVDQIVYQYWDSYNPPSADYRAVYVYRLAADQTLFGWLYNDGVDDFGRSHIPYFVCYYFAGELQAEHLEAIFTCLATGPDTIVDRHTLPDHIGSIVIGDHQNYQPARDGIEVTSLPQVACDLAIQQGKLFKLL